MFIYFLQINTLEVAHVHTSYVNVLYEKYSYVNILEVLILLWICTYLTEASHIRICCPLHPFSVFKKNCDVRVQPLSDMLL